MIKFTPTAGFNKNAAIVLLSEEQVKAKKFSFKNTEIADQLKQSIALKHFSGGKGELLSILKGKTLVIAVGVGPLKGMSLTELRAVIRSVVTSSYLKNITTIEVLPNTQSDGMVRAIIEGVLLGQYVWDKYKASKKDDKKKKEFIIIAPKNKKFDNIVTACHGTNFARDLVNENADVATSSFLESQIRKTIKGKKNFSITVLNKKELKSKGLGLHLAVNQGSKNEPKLVIVKYNGAGTNKKYTALIGKGMTFDTGGLNLKPTGAIETMKLDMGGAAAVIGTLKNIVELKPKRNILFVCGLAENVTGSLAYKPGDVIKGYAGKSVEVANTDAEGRLVLADAISYIVKNYKPGKIIDIATLTGACIVALGYDYSALVTTDDKFSRQLIQSSNETDDRVWRLPIYPELKESVASKIADISNLGSPKGAAGTITAAEFLRQFTEGATWAHLDIAGASFVNGSSRSYFGHGGTGAGVRLLTHYLLQYS